MSKIKLETKMAVVIDGQRKTNYLWEGGKETKDGIAVWSQDSLAFFNRNNGSVKLWINDLSEVVPEDRVICVHRKRYNIETIGIYTYEGKEITPICCEQVTLKQHGIIVKFKGKIGIFSYDGKRLVPCVYDAVDMTQYGIVVKSGSKYGVYDYNGEKILPVSFEKIKLEAGKYVPIEE